MPRRLPVFLSIHDVMPETFPRVTQVLDRLHRLNLAPCTLLVVPGKPWQPQQIRQLRQWAEQGHPLAAHGWHHKAPHIRSLYHKCHAAVLSRDVAEHLSLSPDGRIRLMTESHAWFRSVDLPAPSLYVPPAWALGRLPARRIPSLPFSTVESLAGLRFPATGKVRRLPLTGYEADTPARAVSLRLFNQAQLRLAQSTARPLRISIHPNDFHLHLTRQLQQHLRLPGLVPLAYPNA